MRLILISFMCFAFFSSAAFSASNGNPIACELKILNSSEARDLVKTKFSEELKKIPGLQRAYLWINSRSLRRQILEECTQAERCTEVELGKAVTRTLQETGMPAIVPYAMLVGALVTNAAVNAGVVYLAPDSAKSFTSALMGQISLLSAVAMAPLLQPISSRIGQFFWVLSSTPVSRPTGPASQLHELAPSINSAYTLLGQHTADRITNLRLLLGQSLTQIEIATDRNDMDRVVFWLGDFAMNAYRMYREVRFEDETILRAARSSSLSRLDRQDLFTRSLSFIREQNPREFSAAAERSGELSPEAYYNGLLRALLDLGQ